MGETLHPISRFLLTHAALGSAASHFRSRYSVSDQGLWCNSIILQISSRGLLDKKNNSLEQPLLVISSASFYDDMSRWMLLATRSIQQMFGLHVVVSAPYPIWGLLFAVETCMV
jgi:hypothetical protein